MRPFDHSDLTPQDRFREIAAVLAVGVLRLRARADAADLLTLRPLPLEEGWGEGSPRKSTENRQQLP